MDSVGFRNTIVFWVLAAGLIFSSPAQVRGKEMQHKHTNKLINETSPYLLQHAHNPVNWYPWSNEAFKAAKAQDKPIFLSIGYSTCHWCHVMEQESFSDELTAKIMNEHFISIKVDREQRPDVDNIYMTAVQMMTGSGGWPLSAFLTPDGKPFYGGTYFPPRSAFGRPGFKKVLLTLADMWQNKRSELLDSADKITEALSQTSPQTHKQTLSADVFEKADTLFENSFDPKKGGFSIAPKFPQPTYISWLLTRFNRTNNPKTLQMVEKTLTEMANGGIYDHLGGGFHRYATDARWLIPHFEKMLYDQALISKAYIQTYQITANQTYAKIATEIFDYVLRDMTDPNGGFYSAEDADSEGREGLFYIWEKSEIENLLSLQHAEIFNRYYNITEKGNFEENKTILNITTPIEKIASKFKKEPAYIEEILNISRTALLDHRSKRIRPHRDDKIITAWNALMISSMAYGGAALDQPKYINAAEKAADFLLNTLKKDNRLMRYYRDGKVVSNANLNDYAFTLTALIDLYQGTFDTRWLTEAQLLAEQMIELFYDTEQGGFYFTAKDIQNLIARPKPSHDGVIPSGNSAATLALLRLNRITAKNSYLEKAQKTLDYFSNNLIQSPISYTAMLTALDFAIGPTREVVVVAGSDQTDTNKMLNLLKKSYLPDTVVILKPRGAEAKTLETLAPYIAAYRSIDQKPTAYVCRNYVCKNPVNTTAQLKELLLEKHAIPAGKDYF